MTRIFIGLFLILFLLGNPAYGQEKSALLPLTTPASVSITPAAPQYQLPYPGLLPDSLLYVFKTLRDRVVSFLISDPVRKSEFNLLQANKRLQAGASLIMKSPKDSKLGISTISKGQNYFEEALASFEQANKQGLSTENLIATLPLASKKHIEVLRGLEEKIPQENKKDFKELLVRAEKLAKKVNILSQINKKK